MTIEDGGEWTDDSGINDGSKTYLLLENCLSFQQTDDTQRDDISYFESQDKSDEWSLKVSSLTISEMGDRRTLNDVESVAVGVWNLKDLHYY